SYGFLESPESLEPETSLHRLTISATCHASFRTNGFWATTGIWGRNDPSDRSPTNALLVESNLDFDGRNTVFTRVEFVEKAGRDLALPPPNEAGNFDVGSIVLGYLREVGPFQSLAPGIGIRGSVN